VTVQGADFKIKQNIIELEDSLFGLVDHSVEIDYIDIEKGELTYIKSNQHGGAKGMVYYANFLLKE
jgi:hypothetical protein